MPNLTIKAIYALAVLAALVLACPQPARSSTPEYLLDETTGIDSADDMPSPLAESFREPVCPTRGLKDLKCAVAGQPDFIKDTELSFRFRTYNFDRSVVGGPRSQAWAAGGWLSYESGWLGGRAQVGGVFYTSLPLYAPQENAGSRLLAPGQEAISVLGQAYLRLKLLEETEVTIYRQEVDLPFINRQDNRMVPNTFEGVMLTSSTWKYAQFLAGHLTGMKQRDANSFVSMSQAAGVKDGNEGLSFGGLLLSASDELNWGFVGQYSWDVMNTIYTEANGAYTCPRGISYKLSAQYTSQYSVGDELLGSFDTWFGGGRFSAGYGGAVLTMAFSVVGDGAAIRHPYGGYPGYLSLITRKFKRPEERAWLLGLSWDLGRLGLKDFGAVLNFARGYTPDSGRNASPDEQEFDVTIDYRPRQGWLRGTWLRFRAAYISQDDGLSINEYQLIFNYDLDLL